MWLCTQKLSTKLLADLTFEHCQTQLTTVEVGDAILVTSPMTILDVFGELMMAVSNCAFGFNCTLAVYSSLP
jgi:hypothetical protein